MLAGLGPTSGERNLVARVRRFRDIIAAHAVERMSDLYRLPARGDGRPFAGCGVPPGELGGEGNGLVDDRGGGGRVEGERSKAGRRHRGTRCLFSSLLSDRTNECSSCPVRRAER